VTSSLQDLQNVTRRAHLWNAQPLATWAIGTDPVTWGPADGRRFAFCSTASGWCCSRCSAWPGWRDT